MVVLAVAALMAFVGAFGTDETPLLARCVFWFTVMVSGAMIGSGIADAVQNWGRLASRPWLEALVIAGAIAAPLNLVVIAMSMLAFGTRTPSALGVLISFGNVWIVSMAIVGLNYLLAWQRRIAAQELGLISPNSAPAASTAAMDERFRERLPLHLRDARIYAVASEDHYLRVYCDGGEALILMRLADALAELAAVPGAQTHRSWWVAKDAVERVERGAGKATLHLVGGMAAPVSRSFLPILATQGWR